MQSGALPSCPIKVEIPFSQLLSFHLWMPDKSEDGALLISLQPFFASQLMSMGCVTAVISLIIMYYQQGQLLRVCMGMQQVESKYIYGQEYA